MGQIRVGRAHVRITAPTHVPGIHQGNGTSNYSKQKGHHKDGTADARRSTGISPKRHDPLLKIMPNLPPG